MEPRERFVFEDEHPDYEHVVPTIEMLKDAKRPRPRSECTTGVYDEWREQA